MANSADREAILANAVRLLADAELLLEHKRFSSAFALAVLGLEEVGKVLLIEWAGEQEIPRVKRNYHVQKQSAVAHLLMAPLAIEYTIEDIAIPNLPNLRADGLITDDHVRELARKLFESEDGRWARAAEVGVIDVLKQISLYDDGTKFEVPVRSSEIEADSVHEVQGMARRAMELKSHALSMKVARATYVIHMQRDGDH